LKDIIQFLEQNMLSCSYKQYLGGADCMGCGMQRSLIHLLKGEFLEAFYMYPAIYTLIIMFIYLGLHLRFQFKYGAKILLYLFVLNISIILINYGLKFIN